LLHRVRISPAGSSRGRWPVGRYAALTTRYSALTAWASSMSVNWLLAQPTSASRFEPMGTSRRRLGCNCRPAKRRRWRWCSAGSAACCRAAPARRRRRAPRVRRGAGRGGQGARAISGRAVAPVPFGTAGRAVGHTVSARHSLD